MSPLAIASAVFKLASFFGGSKPETSSGASSASSSPASASFQSSLAQQIATAQSAADNVLIGLAAPGRGGLFDFQSAVGAADPLQALDLSARRPATAALGRNLSLFDPESAYRMMTDINGRDVNYKAQFADLSAMGAAVGEMRAAAGKLSGSAAEGAGDAVRSALQSFATKYNEWIERFEEKAAAGGVLAGTQAAEVALYELRQSVENRFFGVADGVHGLADLGFAIDPTTHRATIDSGKLDAVIAHNRDGAVAAVEQFAASFARSAELLVASGNFIPNRLANLDRAIDFIKDNKTSLQAEFGLGDPARPGAAVAKALAAYEAMRRA